VAGDARRIKGVGSTYHIHNMRPKTSRYFHQNGIRLIMGCKNAVVVKKDEYSKCSLDRFMNSLIGGGRDCDSQGPTLGTLASQKTKD
jgi:hypothetical protein